MKPPLDELFDFTILGSRRHLPQIASDNQTKETVIHNAMLLFAERGVPSVSMRDIAASCGLSPASLYNHFVSKEVLWKEVLAYAKQLYLGYLEHIEKPLGEAGTFQEVLEIILYEPKRRNNSFGEYAVAMIQAEQFRDKDAAEVCNAVLLEYSIDFFRRIFDHCIAKGLVAEFDTETLAAFIMHGILLCLDIKLQERLGRPVPYDPSKMLKDMQRLIETTVK